MPTEMGLLSAESVEDMTKWVEVGGIVRRSQMSGEQSLFFFDAETAGGQPPYATLVRANELISLPETRDLVLHRIVEGMTMKDLLDTLDHVCSLNAPVKLKKLVRGRIDEKLKMKDLN